jgi:hypothetical protein
LENLSEGNHLEDSGVDGWIILGRIFKKWDVRAWTRSLWLRIETGGGTYECGNEYSGSIKCGELLD